MGAQHKTKHVKRVQAQAGEWREVAVAGYDGCCDCGLVHRVEYRLVNRLLQRRSWRAPRVTDAGRREFTFSFVPRTKARRRSS